MDAFVRLPADGIKLRDAVMRCARKIVTVRRMAQMDYTLQQLLDFFPGPAVLVNDMEVNYMNRPLAAFLGFESFAKMTERDVGLEDYIVKLNDEPYNGHPNEWIDSMVNDPLDRDHVLHIENPRHPKSRAHVFGVTFNQFPGSNLRLFSFQDVSALEDEKAVLEDEAATDPLTGALNRRSFLRLLDRMVASEEPFGLIMFDIDHFKVINDTFGHDAGDTVLCEMTQLVGENIRGKDTLARWGGEEFMVLSPGQDADRVRRMAERLRQSVAGFSFSGLSRPVTASFARGPCFGNPQGRPDQAGRSGPLQGQGDRTEQSGSFGLSELADAHGNEEGNASPKGDLDHAERAVCVLDQCVALRSSGRVLGVKQIHPAVAIHQIFHHDPFANPFE